jgi:hypothetical protein
MRRSLLFAFLAFAASAFAQNKTTPDCDVPFTFTIATERSQFGGCGQNGQGTWEWRVVYFVNGFSAVSVELQDAPDSSGAPGTWVTWAGTVTSGYSNPSTATPQGSISATGYFPWVSVLLVSKTGTGSVSGHLYGCREPGCSIAGPGGCGGGCGSSCTSGSPCPVIGVTAAGSPVVEPPVLTGTEDTSGNTENIRSDVNGSLLAGAYPTIAAVALTSSGLTVLVAHTSSDTTTVSHYSISFASSVSFQLEYGTGSACGTGTTALTGVYQPLTSIAIDTPFIVPAGKDLCANLGASVVGGGAIVYSQP